MRKFLVSVGFVATSFFIVLPLSAAEYEVEKGDSLWKIAEEHNTSVAELKEINELVSDVIQTNQILQIDKEITYIVERGDSLSKIAKEHKVTVGDLKDWNNLETDLIIIGERLTIKQQDKGKEEQQAEGKAENQKETPKASEPKVAKQAAAQPIAEKKQETKQAASSQNGETLTMTATAYTAKCNGCSGITATGINLLENPNMKVIAVDPNVIPLGTRVHVEGYGEAIAGDTGGAINGNKIDLHVPTKDEAYSWGGVRTVNVTILN
ncbi:cell wall-binding protein [Gracilibacillus boraciitolerans JCM 21714]|uniref:Cell wall-binding protein n=1 Tax=Gracilibacillus boraciitolerans JCM 21714 TaxID=1298598 RepID=W4VNP6_9BACI|nr:LysM peptidoglycan-binding and 3D domain-containing protein [Gracilibacillus boraciitolerans]GAE94394.1 cell wall-binding protein [Gracilibacillus boraciitolerans JCM 21714]